MKRKFRPFAMQFMVVTYCSILFTLCYYLVLMAQGIFEWLLSVGAMIL